MRNGARLANNLKVLVFVFTALFVFGACAGPQIVTVTPATSGPIASATAPIGPSDTPIPGAPTSTPDPAAPVPTPPPGSTPTPTPAPTATSTPAPTPTPTPIPPIASFEVDDRSGTAPFRVQFTDTTNGPVSSVEWDFGDGTTSSNLSPVHEYTKAGTHAVRLTVSGSNGSDSEIRSSYITVSPGAVVGLSISPDHPIVAVRETVQFEALAVDQFGNGVPVEAEWSLDAEEGILGNEGLFTAGTTAQTLTGVVSATGTTGGRADTAFASFTIIPGPLTTVVLSETNLTLAVQDTHQFTFNATDDFGNKIPDASASWTTTTEAGSIDDSGNYRAGRRSGLFRDAVRLTAVFGGGTASGDVDLTVQPGPLSTVRVIPSATEILWQQERQFSATGTDQFGNELDNLEFTWNAAGGDIDEGGLYTAGTRIGNYTVTATGISGLSKTGTALITIPEPEFFYQTSVGNPTAKFADGVLVFNFGVAVDTEGMVYVADRRNERIQKFSPNGDFVLKWGKSGAGTGDFRAMWGVAVDPTGQVYVTDQAAHRVQVFTSDGQFIRNWGREGGGPGEFNSPRGIAVDTAGNVFVSDRSNHRIQKFSSNGQFIAEFGTQGSGPGMLQSPNGIAVGPSGDVYVADTGNVRINKYSNTGEFLTTWGEAGGDGFGRFGGVVDVATDNAGNVFAIDLAVEYRVQKFDGDGAFIKQWSNVGSEPGLLFAPTGIAVGPDNSVFVSDTMNHRVQQFTNDGVLTQIFGTEPEPGSFRAPSDVAIDVAGNLFAVDFWDASVKRFDSSRNFMFEFGARGLDQSDLSNPVTLAVDSTSNVYTSSSLTHRLVKFDKFGNLVTSWGGEGSGPGEFISISAIAIDAFDNVYVADSSSHRIQKFGSDGTFITSWGTFGTNSGQFDEPAGIAVDQAGNVFVSDSNNGRIQVFSSQGIYITSWITTLEDPEDEDPIPFRPGDLAFDYLGNLYALNEGELRVVMFTPDGDLITAWGRDGEGQGELTVPSGIAIDASGWVYIADRADGDLMVFTSPAITRP